MDEICAFINDAEIITGVKTISFETFRRRRWEPNVF